MSRCNVPGCSIPGWRCDRRHAYTGEVVPGHGGPLPQLAQHHARARRARRLLHAPGQHKELVLLNQTGLLYQQYPFTSTIT